ncbi:hypothetical protein Bca4012_082761 [Brassica carinata]|uniref:U1-type domain-containing protein n=1 Tax=Brassica carinata TaxID=52824 RepID=A0A8X8AP25_BRACI|nr:hypothetical protein Bca52824_027960 [Brassica carinata]
MEFRYRAIDIDRPPPVKDAAPSQSLNPNHSFFSALPIPGCNIRPRVDYVQREIEKEQIRREIIAAETARRRELIAEVAQEMAMEREMAIKSIAEKEEKIATWITQRKLSTHQNQNNNNFSKLKRTYSDPAMYTSLQNLVTSPMTQMPPLQQMLEATAAKEKPVLESNKDKLIILDRPDPIGEDTQTRLRRVKRKARDVEDGLNEPCKRKRLSKFWCDLCNVGANSETVMRSHELGQKHKAAIEKQPETTASLTAPQTEAVAVVANKQRKKVAAKETRKKIEGEKKKTVIIRCEPCNIVTYSENVMETHMLGKKHKAMLKKQYSEQLLETHRLEKEKKHLQSQ